MSAPYRIVTYRKSYHLACGRPRVRLPLNTIDLGIAEVRASQLWAARNAPVVAADKVEDIWAAFVATRTADGYCPKRLGFVAKSLLPFFGYKVGTEISKEDCKKYAAERQKLGRKPSTIRTELTFLSACLNLRYGPGTGKTQVWLPRPSPPRDRHITKEEAAALFALEMAPHVKLFIILALTTGARMTALLTAKWDQVDFDNRVINLLAHDAVITSKRRALVPLNTRAYDALKHARLMAQTEYIIEFNDKPVASVKKGVQNAGRRADVPCSPHVFRHTAGVWMAQNNVPMQLISQYLGHTSMRVTERVYARYSPSFMKDAADALDW